MCQHHFDIPTPDGREELPGVCRNCGEVRPHKASVDDTYTSTPKVTWQEWQERMRDAMRLGNQGMTGLVVDPFYVMGGFRA